MSIGFSLAFVTIAFNLTKNRVILNLIMLNKVFDINYLKNKIFSF